MHSIVNVIIGAPVDWDRMEMRAVIAALVKADPDRYREGTESDDDLLAAVEAGDLDETAFDHEPWHVEYRGRAYGGPVWVGVQLGSFDEGDGHVSLSDLTLKPTPEQEAEARAAYDSLPATVRELLPPFGLYAVWSSS